MKPSEWITLTSVLATATLGIVGYVFVYLQLKQSRRTALDDRLFASRKEAYLQALQLINHRWATLDLYLDSVGKGDEAAPPPEPFTKDEMDDLRAQMDLFASDRVLEPLQEFWGAVGQYSFRFGKLRSTDRMHKAALESESEHLNELEQKVEERRESLRASATAVSAALDKVKRSMREDLIEA